VDAAALDAAAPAEKEEVKEDAAPEEPAVALYHSPAL
jgi:hypothetical protein